MEPTAGIDVRTALLVNLSEFPFIIGRFFSASSGRGKDAVLDLYSNKDKMLELIYKLGPGNVSRLSASPKIGQNKKRQ